MTVSSSSIAIGTSSLRRSDSWFSLPGPLEEEIQYESRSVHLLIRMRAGVVLVLIVRVELDVPAHWEQAARIEIGGTPFTILALVEDLGAEIRRWMVGTDCDAPF